jgi:hypothetical protein
VAEDLAGTGRIGATMRPGKSLRTRESVDRIVKAADRDRYLREGFVRLDEISMLRVYNLSLDVVEYLASLPVNTVDTRGAGIASPFQV